MKINQIFLSVVIVLIVFGTILTTSAIGVWKTTNTKIPATYKNGEFKGQYDPSDIRGSYTFGEISELFNIPLEDLGNAFEIKNNVSEFKCKDLEAIYVMAKEAGKEIGTGSVGIFVALYKGLPIDLTDTIYLTNTAEPILTKAGKMTDEQKTFLTSHLVEPEYINENSSKQTTTENTPFIKGKTTFKEILAIGIKKEEIESILNTKITDTSVIIKDFCTEKGLEFSDVKSKIQSLIDQK